MSEENDCPVCEEGLPPWLATFADLMSLLMCFFVLLLSFATMDALKYKQVAGSMKDALGVQRIVKEAYEIPKGTSVIAQEYSPGKPTKVTPLEIMREQTTDNTKQNLDFTDSTSKNQQTSVEDAKAVAEKYAKEQAKEEANELKKELASAIGDGLLEVEAFNDRVLIRIREKGSFSSGKATLKPAFKPILKQIAKVLKQRDGQFIISGHTDDIPISTKQFESNWELSAARAASVLHFFIEFGDIDPERMEIRAHADNQPLVPNDSWENRAKNRRVEISVLHGNTESLQMKSPSDHVDYVQDQ